MVMCVGFSNGLGLRTFLSGTHTLPAQCVSVRFGAQMPDANCSAAADAADDRSFSHGCWKTG